MKKIAVFTVIDREAVFLPLWVSYYKKSIDNVTIFILTRNNNLFNFNSLNDNQVHCLNIDEEIENKNNYVISSNLFDKYQHQLLKSFDVVIYADVDEFIVHENLNCILQQNFNSPIVTKGINVVQNLQCELPLNWEVKFSDQRNYIIYSDWYDKPLILNQPISWVDGKHNFKTYQNYVDGLYLFDLGKICFSLWKSLALDTMKLYTSSKIDVALESYSNVFSNSNRLDHTMIKMDNNIKKLFSLIQS